MQSPCIDARKPFTSPHQQFLGFRSHHSLSSSSLTFVSLRNPYPCVSCKFDNGRNRSPGREKPRERNGGEGGERVKAAREKDNVWSVDNEIAKAEKDKARGRRKKGKRVRSVKKKKSNDDKVFVSGAMLTEIETVLQTQYLAKIRNRMRKPLIAFVKIFNHLKNGKSLKNGSIR